MFRGRTLKKEIRNKHLIKRVFMKIAKGIIFPGVIKTILKLFHQERMRSKLSSTHPNRNFLS